MLSKCVGIGKSVGEGWWIGLWVNKLMGGGGSSDGKSMFYRNA